MNVFFAPSGRSGDSLATTPDAGGTHGQTKQTTHARNGVLSRDLGRDARVALVRPAIDGEKEVPTLVLAERELEPPVVGRSIPSPSKGTEKPRNVRPSMTPLATDFCLLSPTNALLFPPAASEDSLLLEPTASPGLKCFAPLLIGSMAIIPEAVDPEPKLADHGLKSSKLFDLVWLHPAKRIPKKSTVAPRGSI